MQVSVCVYALVREKKGGGGRGGERLGYTPTCLCVCVCMCVCQREIESVREGGERERDCACVSVCVCVSERERVCESGRRERERLCLCECMRVCVCVSVYVLVVVKRLDTSRNTQAATHKPQHASRKTVKVECNAS